MWRMAGVVWWSVSLHKRGAFVLNRKDKYCFSASTYLSAASGITLAFPKLMHTGLYQYVFIGVRTGHTFNSLTQQPAIFGGENKEAAVPLDGSSTLTLGLGHRQCSQLA